jgi:hypothetical protein
MVESADVKGDCRFPIWWVTSRGSGSDELYSRAAGVSSKSGGRLGDLAASPFGRPFLLGSRGRQILAVQENLNAMRLTRSEHHRKLRAPIDDIF